MLFRVRVALAGGCSELIIPAPTVLFVLKALLERGTTGQMMACALGPGFTASYLPLRVDAA